MKTSTKTLAMLTLSACVITGSAVSSFAATPVTAGAAVLGHQTSTCGDDDHSNAEILARFKNADGSTSFYTICAEGGEVNGSAALTELTSASSNFYGTRVYTGTLDNGQRVMTVACINGNGAMTGTTADVRVPNDAVKGYDLYLVGSDGTSRAAAIPAVLSSGSICRTARPSSILSPSLTAKHKSSSLTLRSVRLLLCSFREDLSSS